MKYSCTQQQLEELKIINSVLYVEGSPLHLKLKELIKEIEKTI